MTVLYYVLGVLAIALGISVSIALREIGHLVPAKAFGVRCSQYMVGFGPTLWSRRRGETEYGVKAVPLGGYVRMLGMFPPSAQGEVDAQARRGRLSAMVEEARNESLAEIEPGEEHRAFYRLSTPKKIAVMLGGPVMNLVIATLIFAFLIPLHGLSVPVEKAKVDAVAQCVRPATGDPNAAQAPCTSADPPSPALAAGLEAGDEFVSIAGEKITGPADVGRVVRAHPGQPVPVVVLRDGKTLDLTITPIANTVAQVDENGHPVRTPPARSSRRRPGSSERAARRSPSPTTHSPTSRGSSGTSRSARVASSSPCRSGSSTCGTRRSGPRNATSRAR